MDLLAPCEFFLSELGIVATYFLFSLGLMGDGGQMNRIPQENPSKVASFSLLQIGFDLGFFSFCHGIKVVI